MTHNSMMDFMERLAGNRELIDRVSEITKSRDTEALRKFLLEQGVTEEDINWGMQFNNALHTRTEKQELSDDDLEMVAGGKGCGGHSVDKKRNGICFLMHNVAGNPADDGSLSSCIIVDTWVESNN
jgi:hypothetical protein